MNLKQTFTEVGKKVAKHSPAIFTTVGVVGLGATAYLAYKSKDKVEDVVLEVERKRDLSQPVDKMEVARGLTEALALPITVGALSVTSILMAHKIQSRRIQALVSALAVEQARNIYFEQKYRKQHGDEEYVKFITPTEELEIEEAGKNGKTKMTVQEVKKDIDDTIGQWYDRSTHYASDDHTYNVAYIDSVTEKLQTILFQRGTLLLNEVLEELGFERKRAGALLGWTAADSFDIIKSVTALGNEELGELKEQIWVTWSRPRYIFDEVEFNGRYSIL